MRAIDPSTYTEEKIGLVGPLGTNHDFVELWREDAPGHFHFVGYFAHVFAARDALGTDAAGWRLTSAAGRQYERLEAGCN